MSTENEAGEPSVGGKGPVRWGEVQRGKGTKKGGMHCVLQSNEIRVREDRTGGQLIHSER